MRETFDPQRIGVCRQEPSPETDRLAHEAIGAAIEVHQILGPGYLESVYEAALCRELTVRAIPFQRQVPISLKYKGEQIGEHRLDLLVGGLLVVELKAVDCHIPLFDAQVLSYLKATNKNLGLLINFNVRVIKDGVKRIVRS